MTVSGKSWILGATTLAAFFRFHALFANSFHADEALFASFARLIAVWRDPLLRLQPLDKPPLLFYLQGLFYPFFGPVEWAARIPNFIASLLLVPLVGMLAWNLFRDERTAVISSFFVATAPLAIQFSATAFTDPLLIAFLVASMVLATSRKSDAASSAILFGLAIATKHQAWLFLPLIIGLGWVSGWRSRDWRRWLAGFMPVIILFLLWEWTRTGELQLWDRQLANFGGIRLAWSWEIWPRLQGWLGLWAQALGSYWVVGVLVILMIWVMIDRSPNDTPKSSVNYVLLLFFWSYALFHWLFAIPIWDRYLLIVLPFIALVVGRKLSSKIPLAIILLLFLLPGAWGARNNDIQAAADQGAGIVAQALSDAPYGTVLYDHWYSWQWRYHFFDSRVFVSWFSSPDALVDEIYAFGDDGNLHYLALPNTPVSRPVKRAVAQAGYQLQPVFLASPSHIQLFQIIDSSDQ